VLLFFALIIGLIALLPDTTDYPLPPQVAASLTVVLGYAFAWGDFFWFIPVWFYLALLTIGLELSLWLARKVMWIIGFISRLVA